MWGSDPKPNHKWKIKYLFKRDNFSSYYETRDRNIDILKSEEGNLCTYRGHGQSLSDHSRVVHTFTRKLTALYSGATGRTLGILG